MSELQPGIEASHEFEVDGLLLTEVVDGRKLRFAVEVKAQDGTIVGVGTHERRVISAGG